MIKKYFIIIPILLLACGCARFFSHIIIENLSTSTNNYPKVSPNDVVVFVSRNNAPKGFLTLARLKSKFDFCCEKKDELINNFKEEAAYLGADGVIILEITK